MSKKIKDGGKAYPCLNERGMTLRDYFAGQALAGLAAQGGIMDTLETVAKEHGIEAEDIVAVAAYELADAMLKERERGDD